MNVHRGTRYWMAIAALVAPAALRAQGFGLNEISACGIGRAFANVSGACRDASSIYWNPAAVTELPGWQVLIGGAFIPVKGDFTQDSTGRVFEANPPTAFVPHFFVNYQPKNSRASYGVGVYVPYGLTSQWPDSFPGRFAAQKASIKTIYIQPNFGWKVNDKWSVGGGPIIAHSSIELRQSLDLSTQTAATNPATGGPITFAQLGIARYTEFGRAKLSGDAWGYGVHLGVQAKPTKDWTFGARWLAPIYFKYNDADATFTQVNTGLVLGGAIPNPANPTGPPAIPAGTPVDALVAPQFASGGALVSQNVSTKIMHPQQVQLGFAYSGFANWNLEADFGWVGWQSFKELPVNFAGPAPSRTLIEDYNNSSSIRLGAEYAFANRIHARAGFAGTAAAAPDVTVTPLLPDQDRANYTAGLTIPFGNYGLDVSYLRVQTSGARGRIDERTSRSQTAAQLNTGVYNLSANIFAFSLKASF